jgi:hypothetical protein
MLDRNLVERNMLTSIYTGTMTMANAKGIIKDIKSKQENKLII